MAADNVASMIELAIERGGLTPKAVSIDSNISLSAVYKAIDGKRQIPIKSMRNFAKTNFIAMASMALQSTGLDRLFQYRHSDRHIQSRIVELKKYDKLAEEAINALPEMLLNKSSPSDLSDDEKQLLIDAANRFIDRANLDINLLMELDVQYSLNLVGNIGKRKSPAVGATTTGQVKRMRNNFCSL